jgi:hypothetical protein
VAGTEVRWKYDEDCGTIEIVGHGELFLSGFAYDYEEVVFAGPIEDVGPASIASLRRALIRYMECVPEGQRRPLPPTWEIHVVVGDEEHPEFVDDLEWVFLEPTHLVFRDDGLEVAQDYPIRNNLVAEEVERCVEPYLRRNRCTDIEVGVADEANPELGTRFCTVSFTPPSRGKTVHDLYRLARGLQEFLVVLDHGGFTMQTLPILLRAGRASMLIGREESQWLEVKSAPYDLSGDRGKIELAQDVARFANAETGGVLIVGARTRGRPEVISAICPAPLRQLSASRHRAVLDARVYPPIEGLHVEAMDYDQGRGLLIVVVPPQPEALKPFLVHGAVVRGRVEGAFISIVRRRGEGSIVTSAPAIHAMLVAGKARVEGRGAEPGQPTGGELSDNQAPHQG